MREILEAQDEHKQKAWGAFDDDPEVDTDFEAWKSAGGDGGRFEFRLSGIGDEASGGEGFYNPMVRAAGYGVRLGMALDVVVRRIEEVALEAPRGKRTESYIKEKVAELRRAVRKFRWQDQEARKAEEAERAAAISPEEEVAEEPRPFLPDPAEHLAAVAACKVELKQKLRDALLSETAIKLLINATMGLGKTYSTMEAIAATAGPPPAPGESVVNPQEEEDEDAGSEDLLDMDLSAIPDEDDPPPCGTRTKQVVFAAQRHDLLQEAAGFLRDELRKRGWADDVIDANIVIGQSRDRGLCLRSPEELKLVTQAHGDIRPSLCVNREGIKCPHFGECEIRGWWAMKRKMATARFVFLTHAHLFSPWAPGKAGERFHPAHAQLVVVDENFATAAIESDPTNIKAGTFRTLLPDDMEIRDVELPENGLGNLIEDALATSAPLKFLRDAGVIAGDLRAAAAYPKSRERRRKIGNPSMTAAERQAFLDRTERSAKHKPRATKISHWLERLARELQTDRDECYSLRLMKPKGEGDAYIKARASARL